MIARGDRCDDYKRKFGAAPTPIMQHRSYYLSRYITGPVNNPLSNLLSFNVLAYLNAYASKSLLETVHKYK